jgi:flagellar biosynthetic protein FlhB
VAGDKTEKATPKKRAEARQKGQVAKSQDLNGALVLLAGVFVLGLTGPKVVARCAEVMTQSLAMTDHATDVVTRATVGSVLSSAASGTALAVAPVVLACMLAGVVMSVAQVGFKITPKAMAPSPKKLNPLQGAKQVFGPNAAVEGTKAVTKVVIVGAIVAAVLVPALPTLGTLVGLSAHQLGATLASMVKGIAIRAAAAYFVIGCADYVWQRHRHEKGLKMDKQEVKEEHKSHSLPAEVKMAQRRRANELARARMMAAVPDADVVVTNPTHFSVALKYDGSMHAPTVLAKGQDLVALRIREIAAEAGVPVMPNPPLARSLHASVEVGQQIPEELFQAVAQVLAHVYRLAGRRNVS